MNKWSVVIAGITVIALDQAADIHPNARWYYVTLAIVTVVFALIGHFIKDSK